MTLRSKDRKLSFEILSGLDDRSPSDNGDINDSIRRSQSDPIPENGFASAEDKPNRRKRKHRNSRRKKLEQEELPHMDPIAENNHIFSENGSCYDNTSRQLESSFGSNYSIAQTVLLCEEVRVPDATLSTVSEVSVTELRQRSVSGTAAAASEDSSLISSMPQIRETAKPNCRDEVNSTHTKLNETNRKLETAESLDWNRLMAEDPNYPLFIEKPPVKYILEEMDRGNSLRSTTSQGNDKERERVYDTIFRLPWRCELLIDVGFYVCLNSFLSLLTIMPIRCLVFLWRLSHERQFKKPSTEELSDFGCLVVMLCGVALLGQADISLIYHMIRGQGTIKLYVVYNVLEIFDKLWQSFGGDVMETLFNSADRLVNCSSDFQNWLQRYIMDLGLAVASSIVHSFILLAQAITLSTCIVAHNNALLALLVSNNFAEIKSNVFKRFSKDNVHSIVYADSVERFHISAFLLFVLAQNILEAEGPWFWNFLSNALVVYICEMAIDIIKHSFIAKFNDIKPIVYSEFLEDLCKQTLNIPNDGGKRNLTFVPLAPACVVIRVLTPVYAAYLSCGSFPLRFLWIILLSFLTFVMLSSLKMLIGMGLEKHAAWYVKRCQNRKLHSD